MQNLADYYSTLFARELFRKQQETKTAEARQQTAISHAEIISDEHNSTDLFSYAVFRNAGCGHLTAREVKKQDKTFLRRWLAFYHIDKTALPHSANLNKLETAQQALDDIHATLAAPRMATLLISAIIGVLLTLTGELWLLLMPTILFLIVWLKTENEIEHNRYQIQHNQSRLKQQQQLLTQLSKQIDQLPHPESPHKLQADYTRMVERLLRGSLHELFPDTGMETIRYKLHAGELQIHLLESNGVLQMPDTCQSGDDDRIALEAWLQRANKGWTAFYTDEAVNGLSRLQYLYCLIRTEQGVLVCHAYYDCVSHQLYSVQRDFYLWRNITHIKSTESAFKADNELAGELPDELYQLHFGEPVQTISLGIRNGDQHCCTLPLNYRPGNTLLNNVPETLLVRRAKRGVHTLLSDLNRHFYQHNAGG